MTTVFPTPAPPNKPVFPPLEYGSNKSTTLMPVSNISRWVLRSSNRGGERWIGYFFFPFNGGSLSIALPTTLISLPRVSGPTGTSIGDPRSKTFIPLTRPSVESIATVRTLSSPRCCCTSQISSSSIPSMLFRGILTALRISGSFPPEKSTSTTGPITCTILPSFIHLLFVDTECPRESALRRRQLLRMRR